MNTKQFEQNFARLNDEQKRAVETLDGPVMVIAGPGTGKTQIIGMRTANIILKAGVDPSNILITTFTEAGVTAIRERLIELIGTDAYKVQVSTIHSFSQDVIKTFPEKFIVEKLETPIDDIESLEIISEIVTNMIKENTLKYLTSYGDILFYVRHIKNAISNIKREGVSIKKFEKAIEEETTRSLNWLEEKRNNKRIKKIEKYEGEHEEKIGKLSELLEVYKKYSEVLRTREMYDFNDMINFVLEKFQSDESLVAHFAETYQYIMLDEYQDTNNPQNDIVSAILNYGDTNNIMVVGDDDQSIYRFQGANIENMLDFTVQYPEAEIIVLDKNYRSSQAILDSAKNLIENNSERLINRISTLSKELFAQRDFESKIPSLYLANDEIDERVYIKNEIQRLLVSGVAPSEIAIITRGNAEVSDFGDYLVSEDIAITSKIENNILESEYIERILQFLAIIADPYTNDKIFIDILTSSLTDTDTLDVIKISTYLYRANYSKRGPSKVRVFDIIKDESSLEQLGVENIPAFTDFVNIYSDVHTYFTDHNVLLGISYFLEKFSIISHIKNYGDFYDLQDVYTFFRVIKSWTGYKNNFDLVAIRDRIELFKKYNYKIARQIGGCSEGGVQIMTAHSSKGLEYEYVFIPRLCQGNWEGKQVRDLIKLPYGIAGDGLQFALYDDMSDKDKKAYDKERQLEEDRRLFFVALTRAKKELYLSFPQKLDGKSRVVSPFIHELGELNYIESTSLEADLASELEQELLAKHKTTKYSEKELEYIEIFFQNYKLSASDLNTFLVSPQEFLLRSVYKYPFEENENSIFGTMYHRTLELFYKQILESGKIQDYGYLEFVFLKQIEREYLSFEEKRRLTERGLEALKGYYETYKGEFGMPLKAEYKFSRRNIFFDGIPITGIIDKIELSSEDYSQNLGGGSLFSQGVCITDYKTGSTKYIGEIKGIDREGNVLSGYESGRYGRQLMFYKLLFENDPELSSNYHLEDLILDFCEGKRGNYKRLSVEFSDEEYDAFKNLVKETYKQMTSIDFWRDYLGIQK